MLTDVQIINNGLSKLSSSRIKSINPPNTPLEQFMASNYPQWKVSELTRRRWMFALTRNYALTLTDVLDDGSCKPNVYNLPNDCLRPLRSNRTEWEQRGKQIYSENDTLTLDYIRNVTEDQFDPLFNDVLSARIAMDSCEYVTQSNTKYANMGQWYKDCILEAGMVNAFIRGPENIEKSDESFEWISARECGFYG